MLEPTGLLLFDLPYSIIFWFGLVGWSFKALISRIYGRMW